MLLVVLDHAGVPGFSGGFIGVDVFFVLSGFLITGLLVQELESTGRISLAAFYARRARRLLPLSSLVIVATVLGSFLLIGGERANHIAADGRWTALFAANFRFIQQGTDYFASALPPSPLQHFWSLAVEEQFYLAWPGLLLVFASTGKRIPIRVKLSALLAIMAVASFAWSIHQTANNATAAYFSPFTRAHELAIGALLATSAHYLDRVPAWAGAALSWIGLAGIAVCATLFSEVTPFPGYLAILPVLATALVVAGGSAAAAGGAESLLRRGPFQWFGKLSYSLYLWHWPFLTIAAERANRDLSLAENLLICAGALTMSQLTFLVIENPIRGSVMLKRRPSFVSISMGGALVATSLLVVVWISSVTAAPATAATGLVPAPAQAEVLQAVIDGVSLTDWPPQAAAIPNPAYSKACVASRSDLTSALCMTGDPNATRTLVMFGDSHGAMWIPTLDLIGQQQHWKVIQLTKPGCAIPDFPVYSGTLKREYTECGQWRAWALDAIDTLQPDLVLVTSSYHLPTIAIDDKPVSEGVDEAWASGLTKVLGRLTKAADKVIVIGDMAYPLRGGNDCLTAHPHDVQTCSNSVGKSVQAGHIKAEGETARAAGAGYVDIIPWFCTDKICPPVIGGITVHHDKQHAWENYLVWLSDAFGRATGLITDPQAVIMIPAPVGT